MRPSARLGNVAPMCVLSGVLSSLNRVSRYGRSSETFGSATISGANDAEVLGQTLDHFDHRPAAVQLVLILALVEPLALLAVAFERAEK